MKSPTSTGRKLPKYFHFSSRKKSVSFLTTNVRNRHMAVWSEISRVLTGTKFLFLRSEKRSTKISLFNKGTKSYPRSNLLLFPYVCTNPNNWTRLSLKVYWRPTLSRCQHDFNPRRDFLIPKLQPSFCSFPFQEWNIQTLASAKIFALSNIEEMQCFCIWNTQNAN